MVPILASWFAVFTSLLLVPAPAQDREGCKDYPLFNRMPNYEIYRCATVDFEAVDFAKPGLKQWDKPENYETIEGKVFSISYSLKEGASPASALQIMRNFQTDLPSELFR
jgi:hypothetical protein